jgi:membrane-bound metal-dependent hydrolase YbcI (DUF457 family)
MPFTPFHFGLHATIGLPLKKYIDVPVFVLASVAVDLEPLAVLVFGLNYPLHGYCHTFLFGALVGLGWGLAAYSARGVLAWALHAIGLDYVPSLGRALLSGILGVWLHILFDSPIYADIRPFYPSPSNPLYGLISDTTAYRIGAAAFVPALVIYLIQRRKRDRAI